MCVQTLSLESVWKSRLPSILETSSRDLKSRKYTAWVSLEMAVLSENSTPEELVEILTGSSDVVVAMEQPRVRKEGFGHSVTHTTLRQAF